MRHFYHSSDELSWKKTAELLVEVAGHGEDTGYEVPSLIVAGKDDLDPYPMAIHDSTRVSVFPYIPYIMHINIFRCIIFCKCEVNTA